MSQDKASFAQSAAEPISLRAQYTATPIVPNEVLERCFVRSRFFFRTVRDWQGNLRGYWNAVPIPKDVFVDFCDQRQGRFRVDVPHNAQHQMMLTEESVRYSDIDRRGFYLYVAGIVVPLRTSINPLAIMAGRHRASTVLDFIQFLRWINERIPIQGMCGYQDRPEGEALFHRFSFSESVQLDRTHTVFRLEGSSLQKTLGDAADVLSTLGPYVPAWDEKDREEFEQELDRE